MRKPQGKSGLAQAPGIIATVELRWPTRTSSSFEMQTTEHCGICQSPPPHTPLHLNPSVEPICLKLQPLLLRSIEGAVFRPLHRKSFLTPCQTAPPPHSATNQVPQRRRNRLISARRKNHLRSIILSVVNRVVPCTPSPPHPPPPRIRTADSAPPPSAGRALRSSHPCSVTPLPRTPPAPAAHNAVHDGRRISDLRNPTEPSDLDCDAARSASAVG